MTKKIFAAAGGVAAAFAIAVPGQAQAAPSPSGQLLTLKTQILQPASGCALVGTKGSWLLGSPLEICI